MWSWVDTQSRFGATTCLHLQYSALKIEARCSSEMMAYICQTTRCHIPKDRKINIHRLENLKPNSEEGKI